MYMETIISIEGPILTLFFSYHITDFWIFAFIKLHMWRSTSVMSSNNHHDNVWYWITISPVYWVIFCLSSDTGFLFINKNTVADTTDITNITAATTPAIIAAFTPLLTSGTLPEFATSLSRNKIGLLC